MKWIAILACAASTAAADRLVMKQTESDNIHIANQGGAINRRADISITVDLLAAGKAKVVATGTRGEHNLFRTFSTDDETKWTTTWTGTWTTGKDSLQLDLAVASDTCKHTKTASGQPPEKLACRAPAKTVHVTCGPESVTVEDFTGTAKPVQVAAWGCTGSDQVGETPPAWMLGKSMCLVRISGKSGDHYAKCSP